MSAEEHKTRSENQIAYKVSSKSSLNTLIVSEESDIDLSYVPTYITYG